MYDDRKPAQQRQPQGLARSTVWRWLSWLGGMPGTLRAAWDLIRQKEPNSALHRQLSHESGPLLPLRRELQRHRFRDAGHQTRLR